MYLRPLANDAFDPALWETFVSTTLGLEVPTLAALPRLHNSPLAKCGCKKFCMDFHGDHTSTCIPHSGSSKSHDWMVSVLGHVLAYVTNSTGARDLCARPSLPHVSAGHTVRTQHGCGVTARAGADVTTSAGQRRGDVEMCVCCLLVLNSVTSTPQWIRQPESAWGPPSGRSGFSPPFGTEFF